MPKIAAIGPRHITAATAALAERVGEYMVRKGYALATGNADGSDQAFARGANRANPLMVFLYLPWQGYNEKAIHPDNTKIVEIGDRLVEWAAIAVECHPKPHLLSAHARLLLTRNVGIIEDSNQVIVADLPRPDGRGGTAHALRVAKFFNVPVINLGIEADRKKVLAKMEAG